MPMPAAIEVGTGQFIIDQGFKVAIVGIQDPMLDRGVERFLAQLTARTGIFFEKKAGAQPILEIRAAANSSRVLKLGEDESYSLDISGSGAKLSAPNPLGILHGLETFLQMVETTAGGYAVPAATIHDQPRFAWRGLLIDVGRHYIPVDVLKRNIDGMAAVKMNVLHLHLYDNEGFRLESKKSPKLQEMGSDGHYYTQAEISDLVDYAHDRGIRVLPEFEMPGHSSSMFAGYPELASGPGPYKVDPGGPDAIIDPTRESTYKFIDKFLGEMSKIFPDDYVHIGGDEVSGAQWNSNPKIQEFMRSHGMKNNQDLQAYFNQRLQKIVSKHGKIMMGWDDVLHPGLPKSVVVQTWRGQESLADAARKGYSGLLSFGYYLDLMWPVARHYAVEPMSGGAATLSPDEKSRILGGESCMWTEWVTAENIDSRTWPRNSAIAERLWSPADVQDLRSLYERLDLISWRLDRLGLTHRTFVNQAIERMAGTPDLVALRTLADVVEPVKDYTRINNVKGPWDFRAPLNHLVDGVPAESETARHFRERVDKYLKAGGKDQESEGAIRSQLITWRDNDSKLQPILGRSFLLQELAPLSQDLALLGSAGLLALDYLDKASSSPEPWRTHQATMLQNARAARADLLLQVVDAVQQLVEASGRVQVTVTQ
ncbi:MAG TPA: family 20 glycosylhydrolase [Terriglobales bacterium]|jgi:hexosaminidase